MTAPLGAASTPEQFQKLAEMETHPRVRARLLELAAEYTLLADAKLASLAVP